MAKGATQFFCSRQCQGYARVGSGIPVVLEDRCCGKCGKQFSVDASLPNRFCSRGCASAGSVTVYRKQRMADGGYMKVGNLGSPADCLRIREAYKYEAVAAFLTEQKIQHIFEFPLGNYVFDLCLTSRKLLIEFDGPYHRTDMMRTLDAAKDAYATCCGFHVARVLTPINEVPVMAIRQILC